MSRYCSSCGSIIIENASFCNKCGTKFEENLVQPQTVAPMISPPKKSNMKLISIIAVIIVVVILVAVVLLLFMGGGDENKIVGTWDRSDVEDYYLTFNSDGTGIEHFNFENIWDFSYQFRDGKLRWYTEEGILHLYSYSFFDNDTTLSLTEIYSDGGLGVPYVYYKQ
jgi:hypothetical protein